MKTKHPWVLAIAWVVRCGKHRFRGLSLDFIANGESRGVAISHPLQDLCATYVR